MSLCVCVCVKACMHVSIHMHILVISSYTEAHYALPYITDA